ncbi:hypothetical protein MNBD_GAMMA25-1610 [hydrothermal vent metagenome]|uniref:IrrE N-terminal-like domain-containing protein n=1 Tax=hydrothermal vent metagenome TaxID=652676 RepID=A0A3B1AZB0_9ZZZZ
MRNSNLINRKIAASRKLYQDPYAHLDGNGDYDAYIPNQIHSSKELHSDERLNIIDSVAEFNCNQSKETLNNTEQRHRSNFRKKIKYSHKNIESKVRKLHLEIWSRRNEFWFEAVPTDPVKLLDPFVAAKCIGYKYVEVEFLGQGSDKEIAGIIDRTNKQISISRRFKKNVSRFTAAHELGHALLHQETTMHRDRPMDGSSKPNGLRDAMEVEADKFATCFLMPENLVRTRFQQVFGVKDTFVLNDNTAFALDPINPEGLFNQRRIIRDLARILASVEQYNGRYMHSLANQFFVSVEAMAIRIEELGLICTVGWAE